VGEALPASWRSATRYGAPLPAADDALALWALTCIEPRTGGSDDDELDVPDALRAAVAAAAPAVAAPASRLHPAGLDLDHPILARWAWLDREIPKLLRRPPDRSRTERIDRILLHRAW